MGSLQHEYGGCLPRFYLRKAKGCPFHNAEIIEDFESEYKAKSRQLLIWNPDYSLPQLFPYEPPILHRVGQRLPGDDIESAQQPEISSKSSCFHLKSKSLRLPVRSPQ